MLVLGFADYAVQARRLAACLNLPYAEVVIHRFPDGESKLTLPMPLPDCVIVCRSLDQPNAKLVELLLCAETARAAGVQRLILVAPYLCYMRQDMAFTPGEAVSQQIIGPFLARLFDAVVTVDPHLHRIERLEQALPCTQAVSLSAGTLLGEYLHAHWPDAVLIGPDSESRQWVQTIADRYALPYTIAHKDRRGDRDVTVSLPDLAITGRTVILVDDMASTARTLIKAAEQMQQHGATAINALITHALFDADALAQMRAAGIGFVGSSDSVSHACNIVHLAPLLAPAVRALLT